MDIHHSPILKSDRLNLLKSTLVYRMFVVHVNLVFVRSVCPDNFPKLLYDTVIDKSFCDIFNYVMTEKTMPCAQECG